MNYQIQSLTFHNKIQNENGHYKIVSFDRCIVSTDALINSSDKTPLRIMLLVNMSDDLH